MSVEAIVTNIAELCCGEEVEILDSTITCPPAVLERVKFGISGYNRAPRQGFHVQILSEGFRGAIQILLGVGGGEVVIAGEGPMQLDVRLHRGATLRIGAGASINGARIIADNADIEIGEDNLWSDEIIVQSNDQHGVIRRSTRELLNGARRRVSVADHAWIGRRAMLMPDSVVGQGAIVGAGSIVTGAVPAFSAVAGVPARVIAEDVTWSRSSAGLSPDEERYLIG